jgi:hypothetical protein
VLSNSPASSWPLTGQGREGQGRASQDDAGELLSTAAAEMPLC